MSRQPRARTRRQSNPPAAYSFAFHGFRDGWYVLTADITQPAQPLDALAFHARVTDWLVNQRVTPGKWSHFGTGNNGEYPILPSDTFDGKLALLLRRPADVLRLSTVFRCTGLSDETLLAAVRAEARVHVFVTEDAAKIAHDAIRRLLTTFGDTYPAWEDLGGETRVAFMLQVRHRLEHPDEPVEQTHDQWKDQRVKDGWKYGSQFSDEALTDPLLVPWRNLSEIAKSRYRLLASVIASVAPLLA